MTEDNDLLLQQFFSEAAQQEIADNGFTEQVMQRLDSEEHQHSMAETKLSPSVATVNVQRVTRLWTCFCIGVFLALFIVFRGWELLAIQLEVLVRTLAVESFSINPLMLAAILFGLLFVGVGELIYQEGQPSVGSR